MNFMAFFDRQGDEKNGDRGKREADRGVTLLATGGEDGILRIWELRADAGGAWSVLQFLRVENTLWEPRTLSNSAREGLFAMIGRVRPKALEGKTERKLHLSTKGGYFMVEFPTPSILGPNQDL